MKEQLLNELLAYALYSEIQRLRRVETENKLKEVEDDYNKLNKAECDYNNKLNKAEYDYKIQLKEVEYDYKNKLNEAEKCLRMLSMITRISLMRLRISLRRLTMITIISLMRLRGSLMRMRGSLRRLRISIRRMIRRLMSAFFSIEGGTKTNNLN